MFLFFFTKKTSFRLNEEKKLFSDYSTYIYSFLFSSFLLLTQRGSLCSSSSRNSIEERERDMPKTRAQKRRIGEGDVWSLIVNNDDICFKHILPRLNSNGCEILVRSEYGDEKVD